MNVVAKRRLLDFAEQYPSVLNSLLDWERDMRQKDFLDIISMRSVFPTVDYLKNHDRYCFNIKGNKYRLITGIHWGYSVYVKELLTHAEYTKKYVKGENK